MMLFENLRFRKSTRATAHLMRQSPLQDLCLHTCKDRELITFKGIVSPGEHSVSKEVFITVN